MGDTNLKTVTFDPAKYKLVPVEPSEEMISAKPKSCDIQGQSCQSMKRNADVAKYNAMLAAVPDQLHGVVEHSGEPVGYMLKTGHGTGVREKLDGVAEEFRHFWIPLYTHPAPSQPNDQVYWILRCLLQDELVPESEFNSVDFDAVYGRYSVEELALDLKKRVEAIQPNQEALVQAALEAAKKAIWRSPSSTAASAHSIMAAIDKIDRQQIIESCKEKS